MSTQLVRLAAEIVIANSQGKGFTSEQLTEMIRAVTGTLQQLAGESPAVSEAPPAPDEDKTPVDWKASIGRNSITCLICGYSGKLLTPHLKSKHHLTAKEYRQQFGIPARTPLISKSYRSQRSKIAREKGIGEKLKEARKAKKSKS